MAKYYDKYEKVEFGGRTYKFMGTIHGDEVFVNAAWPDTTEHKIVEFLEEQDHNWMIEHIAHHKGFQRADPATDAHFYHLSRPHEGPRKSQQVLVDRT